eukprot:g6802.t1
MQAHHSMMDDYRIPSLKIPSDIPTFGEGSQIRASLARTPQTEPRRRRTSRRKRRGGSNATAEKGSTPPTPSLDCYRFHSAVGKGGYGVVFKAQHLDTLEWVAIKAIAKEKIRTKGLQKRVVKEIEVHDRLEHPHIVGLIDFKEDENFIYLVMEYCSGGNLYQLLRRKNREHGGGIGKGQTARLVSQLADGVAYLHKHGVMHRDLKLSNLLLTRTGDLKIADFGLAIVLELPGEEHFTVCGTPNYIAPEVASVPQQGHGLDADLWSVGVVLYSLLVGRLPFDCKNMSETLERVRQVDYTIPSAVPRKAKDLIRRLLHRDPSSRLRARHVLQHGFIVSNYVAPIDSTEHGAGSNSEALGTSLVVEDADEPEDAISICDSNTSVFLSTQAQYRKETGASKSSNFTLSQQSRASSGSSPSSYSSNFRRQRSTKTLISRSSNESVGWHRRSVTTDEDVPRQSTSTLNSANSKLEAQDYLKELLPRSPKSSGRQRSDSLGSSQGGPATPVFSGTSSSAGGSVHRRSVPEFSLLEEVNDSRNCASNSDMCTAEATFQTPGVRGGISPRKAMFEARIGKEIRRVERPRLGKHAPRRLDFSESADKSVAPTSGDGSEDENEPRILCEDFQGDKILPSIDVKEVRDFKHNVQNGYVQYERQTRRISIFQTGRTMIVTGIDDAENCTIELRNTENEFCGRFSLLTLPEKYHGLYHLGTVVLNIVKATTPKLTVRDKNAGVTCVLMSNNPLPNFDFRQVDGGCVRICLGRQTARIRTPRGRWFGVKMVDKNMDGHYPGNLVAVDIDEMWLPHPPEPPGWFQLMSSVTRPRNCDQDGPEMNVAGSEQTINDQGYNMPTTLVSRYCLTILKRAQLALHHCLSIMRSEMAKVANEATTDGWTPRQPFPMSIDGEVFTNEPRPEINHNLSIQRLFGCPRKPEKENKSEREPEEVGLLDKYLFEEAATLDDSKVSTGNEGGAAGKKTGEISLDMYLNLDSGSNESLGEQILSSLFDGDSEDDGNDGSVYPKHDDSQRKQKQQAAIQHLLDEGYVMRKSDDENRFDFEDGIMLSYNQRRNLLTFHDILKGPIVEKFELSEFPSLAHLPQEVQLKLNVLASVLNIFES